jgi:hypothetical protein
MRSEQELRQLTLDLKANKIFASTQIPPEDSSLLGSIFLILSLMDEQQHADFVAKKPAFVYEYYTEAGSHGVNGYPSFLSMRFVTEDELPLIKQYWDELEAFGPQAAVSPEEQEECRLPPGSQIHVNDANPQRHDFLPLMLPKKAVN